MGGASGSSSPDLMVPPMLRGLDASGNERHRSVTPFPRPPSLRPFQPTLPPEHTHIPHNSSSNNSYYNHNHSHHNHPPHPTTTTTPPGQSGASMRPKGPVPQDGDVEARTPGVVQPQQGRRRVLTVQGLHTHTHNKTAGGRTRGTAWTGNQSRKSEGGASNWTTHDLPHPT
jgi:hypothetical protein